LWQDSSGELTKELHTSRFYMPDSFEFARCYSSLQSLTALSFLSRILFRVGETPDYDFHFFCIGWGKALTQPEVEVERHWLLRNIVQIIGGCGLPVRYLVAVVSVMPVEHLKIYRLALPIEPVCCVVSAQSESECSGSVTEPVLGRIYGEVARPIPRFPPLGHLYVYFILPIDSMISPLVSKEKIATFFHTIILTKAYAVAYAVPRIERHVMSCFFIGNPSGGYRENQWIPLWMLALSHKKLQTIVLSEGLPDIVVICFNCPCKPPVQAKSYFESV
jgi:hypothetical protein